MPEQSKRPPVTVEDLLHLKRAERPSQEFWASFERDLRQKQLAALVRKEPWWRGLASRPLKPIAALPVGAAAVLALSVVVFRGSSPPSTARVDSPAEQPAAVTGLAQARWTPVPVVAAAQPAVLDRQEAVAPVRYDDRVSVAKTAPAAAPVDVTSQVPWTAAGPATADSPSARLVAANFERLELTDPDLMNGLFPGARFVAASHVQRTSNHAIDLDNVVNNMARHSRAIQVVVSGRSTNRESSVSDVLRERNVRRMAETDVSEQIGRLDVKGDRLSLRL